MTNSPAATSVVVSRRISIVWPHSRDPCQRAPHEPTNTLVIRFQSHYLDLRIGNWSGASSDRGRIIWAQAGKVLKSFLAGAAPDALPDIDFLPLADSLPPLPAHVPKLPDSGSFETLSNGDVAEMGTMYNPDSRVEGEDWGRNEGYVEVWRRLSPGRLDEAETEEIEAAGYTPAEFAEGDRETVLLLEAIPEEIILPDGGILVSHTFIGRAGPRALGIRVTTRHQNGHDVRPVPVFVSAFRDYLVADNGSVEDPTVQSSFGTAGDFQHWHRVYESRGRVSQLDIAIPSLTLNTLDQALPALPASAVPLSRKWEIGDQISWPASDVDEGQTRRAGDDSGLARMKERKWIVREIR